MPRVLFKNHMRRTDEPDMKHLQVLSDLFDTSLEATARRYVALSDYPIAMVFALGKKVRHAWNGPDFPYFLDVRKGSALPRDSQSCTDGPDDSVAELEYVDSHWWINPDRGQRPPDQILEQTLYQREGYRIVMLYADSEPEEE